MTVQALRKAGRLRERTHLALQVGWLTQLCTGSRLEMSIRELDRLRNGLEWMVRPGLQRHHMSAPASHAMREHRPSMIISVHF